MCAMRMLRPFTAPLRSGLAFSTACIRIASRQLFTNHVKYGNYHRE